ncbi:hypothetical protein D3C75_1094940 [compost metagenome]
MYLISNRCQVVCKLATYQAFSEDGDVPGAWKLFPEQLIISQSVHAEHRIKATVQRNANGAGTTRNHEFAKTNLTEVGVDTLLFRIDSLNKTMRVDPDRQARLNLERRLVNQPCCAFILCQSDG